MLRWIRVKGEWSNTLNRGRIEECPIERKKIQEEKRDEEEKEEREKKKRVWGPRQLENSGKMCHSCQKIKVKNVMGKRWQRWKLKKKVLEVK